MTATLGAWAASVLTVLPPAPDEVKVLAIDEATRRRSRQPGVLAVHLLSALHQRLGVTLWQPAVADQTHAIPILAKVLPGSS